jgi:hypothetical protein
MVRSRVSSQTQEICFGGSKLFFRYFCDHPPRLGIQPLLGITNTEDTGRKIGDSEIGDFAIAGCGIAGPRKTDTEKTGLTRKKSRQATTSRK